MRTRRICALLVAAAALALAGCGGTSGDGAPNRDATLMLDFTPNAVHAGIELAVQRGYPDAEGVHLTVSAPRQSTDAVTLLVSGRTDFAVLDLHDVAIARAKGRDVVAVMAIVQDPLAAVIAQPDVRRPRDLEGRRVGVSGLPSDTAVLDSIVTGDGGDPRRVRRATIGFDAVRALLSRKVPAATAFWNAEGVVLGERRPGMRIFKVDEFGAPPYPELVLCVTRQTLEDEPDLVSSTVHGLQRGYREAIVDPDSAVQAVLAAAPGADRAATLAQLSAVSPAFQATDGTIGTFDTPALRRWSAWEQRFGIVARRPEVALMFDGRFARSGVRQTRQQDG